MQSPEMEFVTFDAQDVIATSGGLVSYFLGIIKGYSSENTFNDGLNAGDTNFFLYKGDDQNIGIALKASTIDPKGTEYYVLNSATYRQGGKATGYIINATGTDVEPSSGEYLDTLDKILGWLTANAKAQ